MKVKQFESDAKLSEEYQQVGIYFSFISAPKDGFKQCHPLVKCRDFLQDAVRCSIPKSGVTKCLIYGFKFDPEINPPIDLLKTRLLVTYKDKQDDIINCSIKMMYGLKLINHYEEIMKLKVKTRLKQINHADFKSPIWLFTGSNIWIKSPILISLYTLLIRMGDKKIEFTDNNNLEEQYLKLLDDNKKSNNKDKDLSYLNDIYKTLYSFTKNYKRLLFKNNRFDKLYLNSDIDTYQFHHNSGIVSLGKGTLCDKKINDEIKQSISA